MAVQLTMRENGFVESFNGTFRAECLNAHWFGTLAEAKRLIEAWRQEYNLVSYCPTSLCS
jgi:transposase InsO family protein